MNEAGFLEAIAAEPDDDTHRLVFADWLTDNGDPTWASFIRDQVALAKMDEVDPAYPALLARTRRSGMLTESRRRPMRDHVPDGGVMFSRGLIAGVEITPRAFLGQASDAWKCVPLDRLRLGWDSGSGIAELVSRPELSRVRTLTFTDRSDERAAAYEPLLTGCPHLGNVRALNLPLFFFYGSTRLGQLVGNLALPALDSLALGVGDTDDWDAFLPARGPTLRRLAVTGRVPDRNGWTWQSPSVDWALFSRHGATLEEVFLRREATAERNGYEAIYAAHLIHHSLLNERPLRHLETDAESAVHLVAQRDWGSVESLAIRGTMEEVTFDQLLVKPAAQLLRSLLIEPDRDLPLRDPEGLELRQSTPAWRSLRCVDWSPDLLAACSPRLLSFALIDSASDLTFAKARIAFPELRSLRLDLDDRPKDLSALLAGLKAPNLCTVVLTGMKPPRAATLQKLAGSKGMPHLSLIGIGEYEADHWWILGNGEATPLAPGILPIEEDWWEPLADRAR
jgi:uncharacterized protein (TIGR02996 family)